MNINKLLLEDYLEDETDLNLNLFVNSVNSEFKINKKNKESIVSLINKYKKDKTKLRLGSIYNYLGIDNKINKKQQNKPLSIEPNLKLKQKTQAQIDIDRIQKEINDSVKTIKDSKNNPDVIKFVTVQIKDLEKQMNVALMKRESEIKANVDPNAKEKYEKAEVLRILGDADKPETLAAKILNGDALNVTIKTSTDPNVLIKNLFQYAGKSPYEYSSGLVDGMNNKWKITRGQNNHWNQGTHSMDGAI